MPTIEIGGVSVPRLSFGLGSLMKWAPNHAFPLPTDCTKEVRQAISAGFRHFNTGDLYTTNPSAAEVVRSSGLKREEIFFSLKLNTYASLGCKDSQHMIDSTKREIDRFGLQGYVDLLQLHFPPRGHPGNLSNREAWRVLESLKEKGLTRIIGVSNWYGIKCGLLQIRTVLTSSNRSLDDYADIMDSADLKQKPQVNEYEFNPFLLHDPSFQKLRKYEADHGIVSMSMFRILLGRYEDNADRKRRLRPSDRHIFEARSRRHRESNAPIA